MAWFNPGHSSDSPGRMGERIQQVTVRKFVGWDKNPSLSGAWESLIPSAESPQVPEAAGKWPSAECSARSPHGRGWQGICWQSHSQAAWNQMEKLVNYCERCLPELLHIQCKREGIKINRVYIPYSVPGNLGFYQVQNPANFTIGHLFISYKVTWKNLSACLSSHPWLLSQASWILKVFIANYSDPFLSHFLQKIHTNILITGIFQALSVLRNAITLISHSATTGISNHPNSRGLDSKVKYNSSDCLTQVENCPWPTAGGAFTFKAHTAI